MLKQRHFQSKGVPDKPATPAIHTAPVMAGIPLTMLAESVQRMLAPDEVWKSPRLDNEGSATEAAHQTGVEDAKSNPFDAYSETPRMPHQETVHSIAMQLMDLLGTRARDILAALRTYSLTKPFVELAPTKGWRATSPRTKVLLIVAAVLECVFGAKLVETLTSVPDWASWAIGIAIASILTASALSIAHAIFIQQPSLLRGRGMWLAGGVAGIGIVFLTAYAIGLGGGAQARPKSGGIVGGSAAGERPERVSAEINWMLAIIYLALLIFLLASVILSHLDDLHDLQKHLVDERIAAQDEVLKPAAQAELAVQLLETCINLVPQAKHRVHSLIRAYVGGARSVLTPQLNSIWDTSSLANLKIEDPAWVAQIRQEIDRLESGREPAAPGQHDMSVQPPQ